MSTQTFIDYYSVLELSPSSSQDQIKTKYKTLIKKNHPDKNNSSQGSIVKTQLINEAYRVLRNQTSRLFDEERQIFQERVSSHTTTTIKNHKSKEYDFSNDELKDYVAKARKQAAKAPIISENSKAAIIIVSFSVALFLVVWGNITQSKEQIIIGGIALIFTTFPFLAVIGTFLGRFYKSTFYFWLVFAFITSLLSIYLYKKFDDAGPLFCLLIFLTFPSIVIALAKRK